MKKTIYLLISGMVLFGAGFLASTYMRAYCAKSSSIAAPSFVPFPVDTFSLINRSLSPAYYPSGIKELSSFKSKIEQYLNKEKQEHPHIRISYYFRDLDNGMTIGVNDKEEFSPASLLKVPLMIAILKEAEKDPLVLNTTYKYLDSNFVGVIEEAGIKKINNKDYTIDELMQQMIVYSDNSAAYVLLNYVGPQKLAEVEKFLSQDVPKEGNSFSNFVSVKNYAATLRILYNCSYLNKAMSQKALSLLSHAAYVRGIRRAVPSEIPMAHKYGIRDLNIKSKEVKGHQLHHFAIVYYPEKPFLIGIMTKEGEEKASEDIIYNLAKITYQEVDRQMRQNQLTPILP